MTLDIYKIMKHIEELRCDIMELLPTNALPSEFTEEQTMLYNLLNDLGEKQDRTMEIIDEFENMEEVLIKMESLVEDFKQEVL